MASKSRHTYTHTYSHKKRMALERRRRKKRWKEIHFSFVAFLRFLNFSTTTPNSIYNSDNKMRTHHIFIKETKQHWHWCSSLAHPHIHTQWERGREMRDVNERHTWKARGQMNNAMQYHTSQMSNINWRTMSGKKVAHARAHTHTHRLIYV